MNDPPDPPPPDDPEQSATETRFTELLRRFWRPDPAPPVRDAADGRPNLNCKE